MRLATGMAAVLAASALAPLPAIADPARERLGQMIKDSRQEVRVRDCIDNYRNSLQILHSSDNESSFQDPNTLEKKVLNYSAVAKGLRAVARRDCIPGLHLTAGDHTIPGPFYQASEEAFGAPGLFDREEQPPIVEAGSTPRTIPSSRPTSTSARSNSTRVRPPSRPARTPARASPTAARSSRAAGPFAAASASA